MSPSGHLTAKTQYAHCWSPNCVPARLEGNKSHHDRGCCSCCCCCCPFSQWLITALRAWHVTRWTLSVSFCLSLSLSLPEPVLYCCVTFSAHSSHWALCCAAVFAKYAKHLQMKFLTRWAQDKTVRGSSSHTLLSHRWLVSVSRILSLIFPCHHLLLFILRLKVGIDWLTDLLASIAGRPAIWPCLPFLLGPTLLSVNLGSGSDNFTKYGNLVAVVICCSLRYHHCHHHHHHRLSQSTEAMKYAASNGIGDELILPCCSVLHRSSCCASIQSACD